MVVNQYEGACTIQLTANNTLSIYATYVIYYIRYLPCKHTVNTIRQELSIYPTYKLFTTYGINRVKTR